MKKRILIYFIVSVIAIIGALLMIAQRLPDDYRIERDITVKGRPAAIYPLVADFKNWPTWNPWQKSDPGTEFKLEDGKTSAVGDTAKWTSEKMGNGKMTITESTAPIQFSYEVEFSEPEGKASGMFQLIEMQDSTRVVWSLRGRRTLKDKIFWVLFSLESQMKSEFEQGLENLKSVAEKAI